jgi:transcriptional regulator with XRE-family HTH domain
MTGPQIRAWRIAQGWTQTDAAARLGVSKSTLCLIEQSDMLRTLASGRVASLIRQWGDSPPAEFKRMGKPRETRGRPVNHIPPPNVEFCRAELARNPGLTDADLARACGLTRQRIGQLRQRWGF